MNNTVKSDVYKKDRRFGFICNKNKERYYEKYPTIGSKRKRVRFYLFVNLIGGYWKNFIAR
jgi:hypothetical protein